MSESSINIILKALANSSVTRSTRGIVMLVIKDANVTEYKEYTSHRQVTAGYEDKNSKLIEKAFNKYGVKNLKVVTYQSDVAEALAKINAEGRPIWKPMHMQPIFRNNPFITRNGNGRAQSNAYIAGEINDVGMDIFDRGLCLPSDNKMTEDEENRVIEIIRACFE